MLTKIEIRNFKMLEEVEVPLGNGFVFVGPNNSGKTSALEALVLWHAGLQEWVAKKGVDNDDQQATGKLGKKRYGVTINRKSLVLVPTTHSNLLWHDRKVMKAENKHHLIKLTVYGENQGVEWKCGMEFYYSSPEIILCRPLRLDDKGEKRMPVPEQAVKVSLALLPPMSGLAAEEPLIQAGRINVLLGQGRTAEVVRNLCYAVSEKDRERAPNEKKWDELAGQINELFGMEIHTPIFRQPTGDIEVSYKEGGTTLDLQSAGRGVQQVILLLAFLYYNRPGTVLLLDEPDAHLEILRQEAVYSRLNAVAQQENSQIIAASHSEKLLNVAAANEAVVAFVGKPHLLTAGKEHHVRKALQSIGWEDYQSAEMRGWILYLEGETDKRILTAFAERINRDAQKVLNKAFCQHVRSDNPGDERKHFSGLKEACPNLVGLLLMDKKPSGESPDGLLQVNWKKPEIENYIFTKETLLAYARHCEERAACGEMQHDFFDQWPVKPYREIMASEIASIESALKKLRKPSLFSNKHKASEVMTSLMASFAKEAGVQALRKADFYKLVRHVPKSQIDGEVGDVLGKIVEVAKRAKPKSA